MRGDASEFPRRYPTPSQATPQRAGPTPPFGHVLPARRLAVHVVVFCPAIFSRQRALDAGLFELAQAIVFAAAEPVLAHERFGDNVQGRAMAVGLETSKNILKGSTFYSLHQYSPPTS